VLVSPPRKIEGYGCPPIPLTLRGTQ